MLAISFRRLIYPRFVFTAGAERECVATGEHINRFVLFDDVPFYCMCCMNLLGPAPEH